MLAKVLVVDDEVHIQETLRTLLRNLEYDCQAVSNGKDALKCLRRESYDIVVADIRMPRMDGLALLREVKRQYPDVDVIMMTAYDMDYSYTDVVEAGASDFIVKPFHRDELQAKIKRILYERELKSNLVYLSIHDGLTGLFNRRYLYQKLKEEVERAKRQKRDLALIIMDVDRFKEYNDAHGHLEGDNLLSILSQILIRSIRNNVDSAYRYGGDEFAVLLIETKLSQARRVAERIRKSFESETINGCTLSLGVAQRAPEEDSENIIRRADHSMYIAKRAGGNRVEASTPGDDAGLSPGPPLR